MNVSAFSNKLADFAVGDDNNIISILNIRLLLKMIFHEQLLIIINYYFSFYYFFITNRIIFNIFNLIF